MEKVMTVADASESLLENARSVSMEHQDEILSWPNLVKAEVDGKQVYLPGYIPYIGSNYFDSGCRILSYTLSQNLALNNEKSARFARKWAEDWNCALNRQNQTPRRAEIHPFDTGHIPVLCAMLRSLKDLAPAPSIYDAIAATNLSKFSFQTKDRTTLDSRASLEQCWEWFSRKEIDALLPDIVLCAGNLVYDVVSKGLRDYKYPVLLKVSFPAPVNVNKCKGGSLTVEAILSMLSSEDRSWKVDYNYQPTLEHIVCRDIKYFSEMYDQMENQIIDEVTGKHKG